MMGMTTPIYTPYILLILCHICQSFEVNYYELATINYGHLTSSQEWIRRKEESKMKYAMQEIGFMVLTNHGMRRHIMDAMWNITRDFFDTDENNKHSVNQSKDYMYGYSADEMLKDTEHIEYFDKDETETETKTNIISDVDQKEMFAAWIGASGTNREKNVLWPAQPVEMKQIWTQYYRGCEKIAKQLLTSFAIVLELENENYFDSFINDHMSAIRALNYPALDLENENENEIWRCSAHSDYGTFTLLRQDGVGGLQLDKGDNIWVDVISDHYDFIVNLGNVMKIWTNNRFQSTRHRVRYPINTHEAQRRQSIAFFHNPNGNAIIKTLSSCVANDGSSHYDDIEFNVLLKKLVDGAYKLVETAKMEQTSCDGNMDKSDK